MLENEVSKELNSLTFKELTELEEKIKKLKEDSLTYEKSSIDLVDSNGNNIKLKPSCISFEFVKNQNLKNIITIMCSNKIDNVELELSKKDAIYLRDYLDHKLKFLEI